MARLIDDKSARHTSPKLLTDNIKLSRKDALTLLMTTYSIEAGYAKSLYQRWRTLNKESGALTQVFQVRDVKDGASVDPYMSTSHVNSVADTDATDAKAAVVKYVAASKDKVDKANKLA